MACYCGGCETNNGMPPGEEMINGQVVVDGKVVYGEFVKNEEEKSEENGGGEEKTGEDVTGTGKIGYEEKSKL